VPSGGPSGWNVYYIVFLSGALSLAVPAVLAVFSFFASSPSSRASRSKEHPAPPAQNGESTFDENPTAASKRTNPRAFVALNSALSLITLSLLILPCVVNLQANALLGLVCILSICLMASLGLLYGIRKKDLDWLMSYRVPTRGSTRGPKD
jgi:NADH:ubiquinone oxidoreductase subunit 3 (subunit A)